MPRLDEQRCFHHFLREAAARCPACRRYFCRECVVEHGQRLLCTACLKKMTSATAPARQRLGPFLRGLSLILGVLLVWFFFYFAGLGLLGIPSSFHEGTL